MVIDYIFVGHLKEIIPHKRQAGRIKRRNDIIINLSINIVKQIKAGQFE